MSARDSSTNSNDGSVQGATHAPGVGIGTGALYFDGDGDYVDTGFVPVTGNSARTVGAWVKTESSSISIAGWGDTTLGGRYSLWIVTDGNARIEVAGDGFNGPIVNDGRWHLVGVTHDGSSDLSGTTLWVDGNPTTTSSSQSVNTGSRYTAKLGLEPVRNAETAGSDARWYEGYMDDARFYDRELQQADWDAWLNLGSDIRNIGVLEDFEGADPFAGWSGPTANYNVVTTNPIEGQQSIEVTGQYDDIGGPATARGNEYRVKVRPTNGTRSAIIVGATDRSNPRNTGWAMMVNPDNWIDFGKNGDFNVLERTRFALSDFSAVYEYGIRYFSNGDAQGVIYDDSGAELFTTDIYSDTSINGGYFGLSGYNETGAIFDVVSESGL